MNEKITMVGTVHIDLFDEFGNLKDSRDLKNLVVQTGKNWIAQRMINAGQAVASHIAIGTGAVSPLNADSVLGTEVARVALGSLSASTNVVSHSATFAAGTPAGTVALTEAGIFNQSSGGTMISRLTFSTVSKAPADTLVISWNLTIV